MSKYRILGRTLFILLWPLLWVYAPLRLRVRVVIRDRSQRVLLVKHSFGANRWMLAGGGKGFMEKPADTAIREIHEELGIDIDRSKLKKMTEEPKVYIVAGLVFRVLLFDVSVKSSPKVNTSNEISDYKWFKKSAPEIKSALPKGITL